MSRVSLCLVLSALLVPTLSAQNASPPAPTAAQQQVIVKCGDATRKAYDALDASHQLRTTASTAVTQIKSLTSDLSGNAAKTLTAFADAVRKLADSGLPASLDTTSGNLSNMKQPLADACKADGNQLPQELLDAQANQKAASDNIDTEVSEIAKTTTALNSALDSVPTAAGQIFDSLSDKIKGLKALSPAADKQPLSDADQKTLAQGLSPLADVLEQMTDAKPAWQRVSKLDALSSPDSRKAAVTTAQGKIDGMDTYLNGICKNLSGWFAALDLSTADPKQKAADAVTKVLLDPGANSSLAGTEQKDTSQALSRVNAVLTAWPRLSLALKEQPTIDTDDLANKIATLSADARTLQTLVARIADALAGDMSQFVSEQVRLYYFTDVDRLMLALNSASRQIGGLAEAQAQAAAQRKVLADAEFDLADAQAEVNRIQKSVLELREKQRQQAATADAANLNALKLQNALKKTQRTEQGREDDLSAAQAKLQQSPNDPALKAAVDKAQAKKDTATTATTRANDSYTQAQSDATAANDKLEAAKADQNGIPAKLAQAQQSLEAAQASVSAARRKMLTAAQAETEAFANARDHAPFWVSDAVAADTDPVKHVIIFGFPDNATLVLRGNPNDVASVKDFIQKFDTPAPQARLTLWSVEINSQMGQFYTGGGAEKLNESLEIVDEELGNTRSLINAAVDLLLTSINDRVRLTAASARAEDAAHMAAGGTVSLENHPCVQGCDTSKQAVVREQTLMQAQSTDSGEGCATVTEDQAKKVRAILNARDFDKWRRVHFFAPSVLTSFDFSLANPDTEKLRHLLPDPSATTTLGEGLLMLALSCDQEREKVRETFEQSLEQRLQEMDLRTRKNGRLVQIELRKDVDFPVNFGRAFARTWQVLGLPAPRNADQTYLGGFTSRQFEITFSLRNGHELELRDTIIKGLSRYITDYSQARQDFDSSSSTLNLLGSKPAPTADEKQTLQEAGEKNAIAKARLDTVTKKGAPLLTCIFNKYGLTLPTLTPGHEAATLSDFLKNFREAVPQDVQVARLAATDEMIKKMIIAFDDDLDRLLIQPMLHRLRYRMMTESKVSVGVVQRESMLATNRLVARIDPQATAQLQVGEEQDILGSVQQLAQLYLAAQGGAALGVLGALQKQPREKPPEIYGVGTGNRFQVTPIFDPSGQALRFKFDYVGSTRITEPSGGVDPQLPRVEHHTVNTEVQLSNLETREISRFEANSKIGIPSHYWGGIPILKDIPYVRPYVPLVGWFVRRAGQNAAAQQNVIFGQTTIYPSISDLRKLLSPVDPDDPDNYLY